MYNTERELLGKQNDVLTHYKEDGSIRQSVTETVVIEAKYSYTQRTNASNSRDLCILRSMPQRGLHDTKSYKNIITICTNTAWKSTMHNNNKLFNFHHES